MFCKRICLYKFFYDEGESVFSLKAGLVAALFLRTGILSVKGR